MTTSNISRRVLDASLPNGAIWRVKPEGQFDHFYAGTALNFEVQRLKAAAVQWLRNAIKTTALADLEIEFGVIPDTALTDAQRRAYLRALMGERCVLPSWVNLENKLRAAGFDVRVYPNDPPVDPSTIFATYPEAYYLVNGTVLDYQERDYNTTVNADTGAEPVEDRGTTVCADIGTEDIDDRGATVGAFDGMLRYPYEYSHSKRYRWPLIFFIAASRVAGKFVDWNMEYSTLGAWTVGANANLTKVYAWKTSGIRSLEVMPTAVWVDPIGPYAQQMLETAVPVCHAVKVQAMSSAGFKAGLVVADKDGMWDFAGIVESAAGSAGEELKYNCANGVSGVRLYVTGAAPPDVGDYARFDDLLIDFSIGPPEFVAASISEQWRQKFEKMVLRFKPLRTWAVPIIEWTPVVPAAGPCDEDDA